jgi:hypothetical protein
MASPNLEAAAQNIRVAIGNRRETFMLVSLTLTGGQQPLTGEATQQQAPGDPFRPPAKWPGE